MYITIILFILGFVFLVKGADILVEGSSSIAKKFGLSNLVIGLTIVAFGTSAPELIVSSIAAWNESTGIALGNIIGSNISNTLLILGVSAIIFPLAVKKSTVSKEIPLSLLAILAVAFLVNDTLIDGVDISSLTRIDGLVLILFFSIFIYYTFGISKINSSIIEELHEEKIKKRSDSSSVLMILGGLVGLYFGGRWIVEGAIVFASSFGLSEELIGLTIVAIGTSLPELAASAVAAYKKHTDIAVGAVIGSNIFNLFWVLGLSSVINPIVYNPILNVDIAILFFATILVLFAVFFGKKSTIGKWEGVSLLGAYISYMIFLIIRG
ncbi:MAG: calcium/sodium antiporter [Patescibacteria group bacterium]|jgi:cation:H+ antiporter|nr:calcium/sodium antiporter [Patescibacteria group bacterium]